MTEANSVGQGVGRVLTLATRGLAYFGGFVLAAIAILTVVSIIGRAFVFAGLGPIKGDFELVETGCAIAVFSFLPWCQLNRGHVTVDIFVNQMSEGATRATTFLGDIVMTVIAAVLAWRLGLGLQEKIAYGETTFILGMPVWYGYALSMIGAVLFLAAALYTLVGSAKAVLSPGTNP